MINWKCLVHFLHYKNTSVSVYDSPIPSSLSRHESLIIQADSIIIVTLVEPNDLAMYASSQAAM